MSSPSILEKCCLVGYPMAGNPTHYIMEQALRQAGLDWRFLTFEVAPEMLEDAVRGIRALGFRGVKIAEPYYCEIVQHVDKLTDQAQACGSINCLLHEGGRVIGDNTEGPAVVELLKGLSDLEGKRVLMFGAGRMAKAIAAALSRTSIASLKVACRNLDFGRELIESVNWKPDVVTQVVELDADPISVDAMTDVLINATPMGSNDIQDQLPLSLPSLRPDMIVVDVVFNPHQTPLVQAAGQRGCRVIDGIGVFVQQNALALKIWSSPAADVAAMREAFEEFLSV